MPEPRQHRLGVVINPTSGRGKGAHAGAEVLATLAAAGVDFVDLSGTTMADAKRRAQATIAAGAVDSIVVVGGDGMSHLGVNLCAGTTIPLGIVGVGTGNDSARSLGLAVDDAKAATRFIIEHLEQVRAIDAIKLHSSSGEHWVLGTASAGFDALVNRRANRMAWPKGPRRYELAMLLELVKFKPIKYQIEVDGQPRKIEAMLCAIANAPAFGGGMLIAPQARMDDALADLFVVHAISRLELIKIFPKVYTGGHVSHPAVEFIRGTNFKIDSGPLPAFADGESVGHGPLEAQLVPHTLRVFAPPVV